MSGFNYPVKVLKKKLSKEDYKPFAIDCGTGSIIKLERGIKTTARSFLVPIAVVLTTVTIAYFVIIEPLVQTTKYRGEIDEVMATMQTATKDTVESFKSTGEVDSEYSENGLITITLDLDKTPVSESIKKAMEIETIKEVTTDDKTITVTFLSSE